jgi:XXXCH domain-containing protein
MSQSVSREKEIALTPAEAAELLRSLAGQLEAGGIEFGEVLVQTDGPVQIKQSIKTKSDEVSFKFKLKYETALNPDLDGALNKLPKLTPKAAEVAAEEGDELIEASEIQATKAMKRPSENRAGKDKSSFKSVKKDMSRSFKAIKKSLADVTMPSKEDIETFALDCEEMTTYPGKSEEHYQDFLHHVGDMKTAAQKGDHEALARAIAEIGAMKKTCHSSRK